MIDEIEAKSAKWWYDERGSVGSFSRAWSHFYGSEKALGRVCDHFKTFFQFSCFVRFFVAHKNGVSMAWRFYSTA